MVFFFFNFQNTNKILNIPVFILFSPQLHANGKYYSPTQVPMHTRTTVNQYTVHTENPRLHDEYLQSVNASEYPALADRLTVTNEHCTQGWSAWEVTQPAVTDRAQL